MTMLNREVFVSHKVELFTKSKELLDQAGIRYKTKIVNNGDSPSPIFTMFFSSSRRARGTMFEKYNQTKFYYIYVDKSDVEAAKSLLGH